MSLNFNNVIIGGTSGGGGQTINNEDITVTQNGVYTAGTGYTGLGTVTVNTPVINNQDMTITENGEYTAESGYSGLGTVTVDVPTGGGGGVGTGEFCVKVIDYDGSLIDTQYLNAGDTYTLPAQPEHDGLIFQEWSSTKPIVNNTITITNNNVLVGAIYTTASGKSEIDIYIKASQSINLSGISGEIDWGDGTINSSGSHTYSTTGDYTIKFSGGINSVNNNILGTLNSPTIDYVRAIRLSSDVTTIPYNAFQKLRNMEYITIPKGVTQIGINFGQGVFKENKRLTHLILPSTVTSISIGMMSTCYALKIFVSSSITSIANSCFYQCYALDEIVIPDTVTAIEQYAFYQCFSLSKIILPNAVTTIGQYAFYQCYGLPKITFSNAITTIGQYAFYYCYALAGIVIMPSGITSIGQYAFSENLATDAYDFSNCTSVPTLDNTNAFSLQQSDKIYVPANLLDEWKAATTWSNYSSFISVKP